MSMLPIDAQSLIYGSNDGALTVMHDRKIGKLMMQVSKECINTHIYNHKLTFMITGGA